MKKRVCLLIPVLFFMSSVWGWRSRAVGQSPAEISNLERLMALSETGKVAPINQAYVNYVLHPRDGAAFGYVPPLYDRDRVTQHPIVRGTRDLPAHWDWRENGGTSPVGNQGSTGSCWLWASLKGLEANILARDGTYYDLSERHVFNCNPWNRTEPPGNRGGHSVMVYSFLSRYGVPREEDDPWGPPWNECTPAAPFMTSQAGYRVIPYDIETIKQRIHDHGPVVSVMYASFTGFNDYDGSYVLYWAGNQDVNHAIQIVGWDDTRHYPENPPYIGFGSWICQNSWGTDWGEDGFFYIAYDDSYNAHVGEEPSYYSSWEQWGPPFSLQKHYTWAETGWSTYCGDPSSPDRTVYYGLSKFTADEWDKVAGVTTAIPDGNTVVDAWLYSGFDGNDLIGEPLRHSQASFPEGGQVHLVFDRPYYVAPDDTFVVLIRNDCETAEWPIAAEYCWGNDPWTYCTYETEHCYESSTGEPGTWYDSGAEWQYDLGIDAIAYKQKLIKVWPGGGVIVSGSKVDVGWEKIPSSGAAKVSLDIVAAENSNTVILPLATLRAGTRSYSWTAKPLGKDQKLRFRVIAGDYFGLSEPFSIQ